MKKIFLILTVLGLSSSVLAMLPPYHHRADQLKTLIDSPAIKTRIWTIQSMEENEDGTFIVKNHDGCYVRAELIIKPPQIGPNGGMLIGGTQYKSAKMLETTCKETQASWPYAVQANAFEAVIDSDTIQSKINMIKSIKVDEHSFKNFTIINSNNCYVKVKLIAKPMDPMLMGGSPEYSGVEILKTNCK